MFSDIILIDNIPFYQVTLLFAFLAPLMSRRNIPKKALIRQKKGGTRVSRAKQPPDSSEENSRSSSADSERGFLEGPLDPVLLEEVSSLQEEQEDLRDYCPGGYYPAEIGETLCGRYKILRKLGWGHFSTVWLVADSVTSWFAAVKVSSIMSIGGCLFVLR